MYHKPLVCVELENPQTNSFAASLKKSAEMPKQGETPKQKHPQQKPQMRCASRDNRSIQVIIEFTKKMIRVAITGVCGRMGRSITQGIAEQIDMKLVGAIQ